MAALDNLRTSIRDDPNHPARNEPCTWSVCQLCLQYMNINIGEGTLAEVLRSRSTRVDGLLRVSILIKRKK